MKNVIYKLTSPSGKQYIGLTTNFKKRMRNHLRSNSNTKIYHAINKYGFDNFKKEVLIEVADPNLLPQLEIFYIKIYNTYKNGYNMTLGGEGTFGQIPWNKGKKRKPFSEEHKRKLSEATKGKKENQCQRKQKENYLRQRKVKTILCMVNMVRTIPIMVNRVPKKLVESGLNLEKEMFHGIKV